ncbi:MAG: ATP-binding protein [Candidatus Eremiobacteraeota bacterium]|nr:ATP-binding protein [Candidatus Eremiobacteraeota bacterium]
MDITCPACQRVHPLPREAEFLSVTCRCGAHIAITSGHPDDSPARPRKDEFVMRRELTALIEISRLMVSIYDRERLLGEILALTPGVLGVEAASIILYDKERDDMAFYLSRGPGEKEVAKIRLAKGEGIAGWVFLNRKSVISLDTSRDERFCRKVDDSVQYTSRNLMCVPVMAGEQVIGVMEAVNKKEGECFTELDLALFESIANHVGEALEKTRLIEENIKSMRLAAIGQTLSSLAHCIKNILNGLTGGSFLINKALDGKNFEMAQNGWNIVEKCIMRIKELSMNMLAYSKDRKPDYKMESPNRLIHEVADILSKRIEEQNVAVRYELDEGIKEIPLDSFGIFRCLLNILINALEACPREGGEITIHTGTAPDESIAIRISDNGAGIGDDELDKIFNLFYSTKDGRGTGLGLAVTKKIIEEHGGKIWVHSAPLTGTTFTIELPLRIGNQAP